MFQVKNYVLGSVTNFIVFAVFCRAKQTGAIMSDWTISQWWKWQKVRGACWQKDVFYVYCLSKRPFQRFSLNFIANFCCLYFCLPLIILLREWPLHISFFTQSKESSCFVKKAIARFYKKTKKHQRFHFTLFCKLNEKKKKHSERR